MSTLELSNAIDDFFGDNLFSVPHLVTWLHAKGLALPIHAEVKNYMFVQACALLGEVQGYAYDSISHEKAYALAQRGLARPENFYRPAARVKISCNVADQWRTVLIAAVRSGELNLLDYASKLPVLPPSSAPAECVGQDQPQGAGEVGHEWKEKAWALAVEIRRVNFARGWGYDKLTVAGDVEKMLGPDHLNLKTKTGKTIDRGYIVRYALTGWSRQFGVTGKQEKK